MRDSAVETRKTAIDALVIAHRVIQDEAKLMELLSGEEKLPEDQQNLLAYYFSK